MVSAAAKLRSEKLSSSGICERFHRYLLEVSHTMCPARLRDASMMSEQHQGVTPPKVAEPYPFGLR